MKICVLDLETTGKKEYAHGIHQFAGEIYVEGELQEVFNFYMRPFRSDDISLEALEACGKTLDQILAYPDPKVIWPEITDVFRKYIDPFDHTDKFLSVGYGNSFFDMKFLPRHAQKCGDTFFWSWFHKHSVDVYFDAVGWLAELNLLHKMPNMKLATVYETAFGRPMPNAHEAGADVKGTRELCNFLRPRLLGKQSES